MKGFITNITYRVEEDQTIIHLFGRLENKESFLARIPFKPYFFMRSKDLDRAIERLPIDHEKTELKTFDGEELVKITCQTPKEASRIRRELKDFNFFESDISTTQRYLIDKNIKGIMDIDGKFKKGKLVDRVYNDPSIRPADNFKGKLKVLSLDIETDPSAKKLYSIALFSEDLKEVMMVYKEKVNGVKTFPGESELLEYFTKRIIEIDPDIIIGWNIVDFDIAFIEKALKKHKLDFKIGRTDEDCGTRIYTSFFRDSSAKIPGRIILDGISLLKSNFIKLPDYKLATASKELLKDKKLIEAEGPLKGQIIENNYKKHPKKLAEYNLKDTELVYKIIVNNGILKLAMARSQITGMLLDRISASIASLDSLYIRETRKRGYACSPVLSVDKEEQIKGGFVMEPKPGIYDNIIVLDFKSLYPSIIRSFNIDPLSFDDKGTIVAPNRARFLNKEGILPEILQSLWGARDKAKKKNDKERSYAIKITMNSFFGVLANPACRFFNLDIANAITSFGRYIITETAKIVEKKGYSVIYGDTDSIFIDSKLEDTRKAITIGKTIANEITKHYTDFIKKEYDRKSFIEFEFEKLFTRFILPKLRGKQGGAKKRYAGLDTHGKIEITGLEFVRSDWTELAREFQFELLKRLFEKKDIAEFTKKLIEDVKSGKLDKKLIYRKSIRKPLSEYVKTTPPHVKAAKKLNELHTTLIEYYITEDGPEPVEMLKSKIDYEHYIEKQIKPIAETVLAFFDMNFDDLLKHSSQQSLLSY